MTTKRPGAGDDNTENKTDEEAGAKPDAYATEQRLHDGVRDAVLSVMNETTEEAAYWSRGLEILWEYDGTMPISAAAMAWRRDDTDMVTIALNDAIELERLAQASRTSRGLPIDEAGGERRPITDETEHALDQAVRTYVRMQNELESEHCGKWALVQGNTLLDLYPSREWAVKDATQRCAGKPYLVWELGRRP